MNFKKFEYLQKDMPLLKKDIVMRMTFVFAFFIIFVWQFVLFVVNYLNSNLTMLMTIISSVILIISLVFSFNALLYALKSIKLMQVLKRSGSAVSTISILPSIKKRSFIKLYSLTSQILAVVMLLVLASAITYSVLEFVHFSIVSFYLPLLTLVTFTAFNTVYHLHNEIHIVETIREYHEMY